MEELIAQIAAAHGYPAEMVERSAEARAGAMGVGVEDVLRQWAGGEAAAAAPSPAAPPPSSEPPAAAPAAVAVPDDEPGIDVEVLASPTTATSEEAEEAPEAAADEHEASPARTAPTGSVALTGFPRWLAAAFIIIPVLAMLYLLEAPAGPDCGVAGQLALDPVTGLAENCDGTEYGVEIVDFFAMGQEVYDVRCAACHGSGGGGGAGQVLSGGAVLASFPGGQCVDHTAWIALATAGWPDETYGALAKPVGGFGQMPGFEGTLTDEELAAVALYERVAFGGQALADAEADCGLAGEDQEMAAAP